MRALIIIALIIIPKAYALEIPHKVISTAKKFNADGHIKWKRYGNTYGATFKVKGLYNAVNIDSSGILLEGKEEILFSNLNITIKDQLTGYNIRSVTKYNNYRFNDISYYISYTKGKYYYDTTYNAKGELEEHKQYKNSKTLGSIMIVIIFLLVI